MGYVKVGNMEMEWFDDLDYQRCLTMFNEFKLLAAKEWEVNQDESPDEDKRHKGSEGNPAQ